MVVNMLQHFHQMVQSCYEDRQMLQMVTATATERVLLWTQTLYILITTNQFYTTLFLYTQKTSISVCISITCNSVCNAVRNLSYCDIN